MDYLNRQEIFSLRLNKSPATPLIHIVLRLIVFGANSERNLDRALHQYPELLIFVVFPYVPILTTNIQTVSNSLLRPVIQNCPLSCYFPPYNDRNPFAEATVYLGFNILL
jgi:hypothetical protein